MFTFWLVFITFYIGILTDPTQHRQTTIFCLWTSIAGSDHNFRARLIAKSESISNFALEYKCWCCKIIHVDWFYGVSVTTYLDVAWRTSRTCVWTATAQSDHSFMMRLIANSESTSNFALEYRCWLWVILSIGGQCGVPAMSPKNWIPLYKMAFFLCRNSTKTKNGEKNACLGLKNCPAAGGLWKMPFLEAHVTDSKTGPVWRLPAQEAAGEDPRGQHQHWWMACWPRRFPTGSKVASWSLL